VKRAPRASVVAAVTTWGAGGIATAVSAVCGVALGVACGSSAARPTLGHAGTDRDDGAGQLAAASAQILVGGADDDTGFATERRTSGEQGGDFGYGGGAYGGGAYGAGAYGGYLYGGYVPYGALGNVAPVPPNPYSGTTVVDGGAITGTVRWPHPPSAPAVLAMTGCGDVTNPTLVLGHSAGVGDTVVYLARVDRGRAVPVAGRSIQIGGSVERRGCVLAPTVQIVSPMPSSLSVLNADAGPLELRVGVAGKESRLALEEGTSRTTALAIGAMRVSDAHGGLIPAWVVAGAHPYYTLTDGEGRFRIDDVPPGAYDLVVWHSPVVVGIKDGKVAATEPVEVRRPVVVRAAAATVMAVDLPNAK
jgi:hypothetical protein